MALHLPRGEPRGAGPHARHLAGRWWRSCSPSASGRYRNPLEERAAELTDPGRVSRRGRAGRAAATPRSRGADGLGRARSRARDRDLRMLQAALGGDVRRLAPGDRPVPGTSCFAAPERAAARPVQGAPAPPLPRTGGPVPGLRRLRPGDHRQGDRRLRDRGDRRGPGARAACRGAVRAAGAARPADQPQGERGARLSTTRTSATSRAFAEVWPAFREFVGDDLLVAHNGQHFDMPVLRRLAAGLPGMEIWSSSTPCRWPARCWTRAPSWRTWRTASASRPAARTTRSTTRPRWPA